MVVVGTEGDADYCVAELVKSDLDAAAAVAVAGDDTAEATVHEKSAWDCALAEFDVRLDAVSRILTPEASDSAEQAGGLLALTTLASVVLYSIPLM